MLERGYSSAGRAPALQAGGQEFDPPYLHQKNKDNILERFKIVIEQSE